MVADEKVGVTGEPSSVRLERKRLCDARNRMRSHAIVVLRERKREGDQQEDSSRC